MGRYIARRLAAGARGHLRRHGVRVRRHPPDRRSREVHAAALGHRGTARRDAALRSGSTDRSRAQFVDFLGDLVRLDLGESTYVRGQSALSVVFDYLPRTLQLVAFGMLLAIVLSIPLGVLASRKPGGPLDRCSPRSVARRAVDAAVLPRLRAADRCSRSSCTGSRPVPGRGTRNLVLPAVCLALPAIGRLAMVIRSSMIDELNTQYVKVPRPRA